MTDAQVPERYRCEVCGREESDGALLQSCFRCGASFHLNPRSDVAGFDCGDVWIGASLGIEFYCARCIEEMGGRERPAPGEPTSAQTSLWASLPAAPLLGGAGDVGGRLRDEPPPPRRGRLPSRRRRYRRIDGT